MPKVKNVSGVDRTVPALGGRLVVAGAVVEVPEDAVYGFTAQEPIWSAADKATQAIHDAAVAAEVEAQNPTPTPEPVVAPSEKENA